jgi:heavy metal sensor kinase
MLRRGVSISLRLTSWLTGALVCGLVVFGVAVWLDLGISLERGRDRTLCRRAARVADLLSSSQRDSDAKRERKLEELLEAMPEGRLVQVFDPAGDRIYPAIDTSGGFPWREALTARDRLGHALFAGKRYRVLRQAVTLNAGSARIVVAGQLEDNRQLQERFAAGLETSIPVLLVLSAIAAYFLSRRILKPVGELTAAMRSIRIGNLSERLAVAQTRDELARMAETWNDMLARLEDAVGRINRFTADASHELRSPISFIRTVAECALRDAATDAASRVAFQEIVSETEVAATLLEDMLALARADAGRAELVFAPVQMSELIDEVKTKALAPAQAKRQSVTARIQGRAVVNGDRGSLRRLLWALVDNAIKYTPAGGHIEIGLTSGSEVVQVTVQDDGMGIPEDLLPRVFERFFRADPSRGEVEGSGLGLAIAKWIAEAHGGSLTAAHAPAGGTVFTLRLSPSGPLEILGGPAQNLGPTRYSIFG